MSILPSPLKSPTLTSAQVTDGFQFVHWVIVKLNPLDTPTHQLPLLRSRPAMSMRPSPLKSPVTTSTHLTAGFQAAHCVVVNPVEPLDSPTHTCPEDLSRPTMSF